jgi:hypothetical protein
MITEYGKIHERGPIWMLLFGGGGDYGLMGQVVR